MASQKRKYNNRATAKLTIPVITPYNYGDESQYSLPSASSTTPSDSILSDRSSSLQPLPTPEHTAESSTSTSSTLPTPSSAEFHLTTARPYRRIPVLAVPSIPPYVQSLATSTPLKSPVALRQPDSKQPPQWCHG
ncbi:hypothetical protein ARMGADRAFT_1167224, partial [Armillaria gallica]